jgi:hypothetical protein
MTTHPSPERTAEKKSRFATTGEGSLGAAIVAVAVTGLLLTAVTAVFWGTRMAVSVATGAAIASSNLYVVSKIVGRVMSSGAGAGAWSLIAVMKIVVLVAGVGLLLTRGLVDPIALLVGYGSLPIGIALSPLLGEKRV